MRHKVDLIRYNSFEIMSEQELRQFSLHHAGAQECRAKRAEKMIISVPGTGQLQFALGQCVLYEVHGVTGFASNTL